MRLRLAMVVVCTALAFAVGSIPAGAQLRDTRIHVLHAIPGVDVDLQTDGEVVVGAFGFGEIADLSEFGGQTLSKARVVLTGTDDIVLDLGELALPAEGNFTFAVHLDADGEPTATLFENDLTALNAGQGRLVVRHAAAAPPVDVRASNTVVIKALSNGGESALELAPAVLDVDVVPTGSARPRFLGPIDIEVAEGESKIIYAVGSGEKEVFALVEIISDLETGPGAVNTGTSPLQTGRQIPNGVLLLAGASLVSALAVKRLGING